METRHGNKAEFPTHLPLIRMVLKNSWQCLMAISATYADWAADYFGEEWDEERQLAISDVAGIYQHEPLSKADAVMAINPDRKLKDFDHGHQRDRLPDLTRIRINNSMSRP